MAPSPSKKSPRAQAAGHGSSKSKGSLSGVGKGPKGAARPGAKPLEARAAKPKAAKPIEAIKPAIATKPTKAATAPGHATTNAAKTRSPSGTPHKADTGAPAQPQTSLIARPETTLTRSPRASSAAQILITGATGFLGSHLVRQLVRHGDPGRIRTLQTSAPAWLSQLGVQTLQGSVTSEEDVKRALEGVSEVYHLAGMVSFKDEDAHKMYALHVDGTRLLGRAAVEAGVRRVVMSSTSGTIAVSKHADASLDETCGTPLEIISRWPYYASKAYQEEAARRALGDQVELVTVNPSLLLGPGDDRLSSTRVVLQFLGREIRMTPTGGMSFVDVRDVAALLPVAMQKGRTGERYLVGAANWDFEEFFGRLSRMSKVAAPGLKLGGRLPLWLSQAQASLYRHWGKSPPIEPTTVEMASYFWYFDSRKAHDELGFVPRDLTDTLFDTVTYVRERFLDGFKGAVTPSDASELALAKDTPTAQDLADEAAFEASLPS